VNVTFNDMAYYQILSSPKITNATMKRHMGNGAGVTHSRKLKLENARVDGKPFWLV